MKRPEADKAGVRAPATRRSAVADVTVRTVAIVLLLAGGAVGLSQPLRIALMAVGVLIVVLLEGRKHRP
jgi:hypothetical protein